MIIDVHAHGLSEDFIIEMADRPGREWRVAIAGPRQYVAADYGPLDPLLYDLDGRLANLRARQVALQLVCPPPPLVATRTHAADAAFARRLNQSTARLVAGGDGFLTLPCGVAEGCPIGMMLVARPFAESTLYTAAHAFEQSVDWRRIGPDG